MTTKQLKLVPKGEIFKTGKTVIEDMLYKWVAKKGGIEDWVIYYGPAEWSEDRIAMEGDKLYDHDHIQFLIKPTKEMFNLYRF